MSYVPPEDREGILEVAHTNHFFIFIFIFVKTLNCSSINLIIMNKPGRKYKKAHRL